MLPPMIEKEVTAWDVRFVEKLQSAETDSVAVNAENNLAQEVVEWDRLSAGKSLTVPAFSCKRVLLDLKNYYCCYPELIISGGKGSMVRVKWAESLYDDSEGMTKSNRDVIEGKYMLGTWDVFLPDGANRRCFNTLWWQCGRYVELFVQTGLQPLVLESFRLLETRYPLEMESGFECDDKRLESVIPIAFRSLQMCSHETFMDCPYYEQMMYIGDTRLQMLITYAWSRDLQLARKAISMLHASGINHTNLVNCAYPAHIMHIIPSFCLWWISMLYDYALWNGDKEFISTFMPKAREIIDLLYMERCGETGLLKSPKGWNLIDWADDINNICFEDETKWSYGVPSDGGSGINSIFNLQMVYTLKQLAALEEYLQEPELASRARRLASQLMDRILILFWDEEKGMFANDLQHRFFSEHCPVYGNSKRRA